MKTKASKNTLHTEEPLSEKDEMKKAEANTQKAQKKVSGGGAAAKGGRPKI